MTRLTANHNANLLRETFELVKTELKEGLLPRYRPWDAATLRRKA